MNSTEAAALLNCSVSTVSRISTGDRRPSVDLMMTIEDELGWSFTDQAMDLREGTYAQTFKQKIEDHRAA
jgi:hypothetical protein